MTLTRENRNTWRETSGNSSFPTKISTWNDEESSPSFGGERPANNRLSPSLGTACFLFIFLCLCYPLLLILDLCVLDLSCMCLASVLFNLISSSL
jgi:hypothetical protein